MSIINTPIPFAWLHASHIPAAWLQTYRKIRDAGFPDAVLAGGCLRDLITGRADKVSDLDIFVSEQPNMIEKFKSVGYSVSTLLAPESVDYLGAFDKVHSVHDLYVATDPGRFPLTSTVCDLPEDRPQIIVTSEPMDVEQTIRRFDLGVCQVAYTDEAGIQYTRAFTMDVRYSRFTVTRCESREQFERTYARWRRLTQKYPGWELRVPKKFVDAGYATATRYPVPLHV